MRAQPVIIINPIAGRRGDGRQRIAQATSFLTSADLEGEVLVTTRAGHAHDLARAAAARGASVVAAWGGDGTVNEVASALAGGPIPLAIVPSGSGNGLARELGVPLQPRAALALLLAGDARMIDAGEVEGRLFFNIAGIGLDAQIAHRFAQMNGKRGLRRYVRATIEELARHAAREHTIRTDLGTAHLRTLLIAIANGRQYGNGALIAPGARLDDGRLDVVAVGDRPTWRALLQIPHVFRGTVASVAGVESTATTAAEITSTTPVLYHIDGEPMVGGEVVRFRVRPNALLVRVPSGSE